ncbi:ATP-binding cassette domain-containing protein [Amycolatopsis sp. YIM 10]|uniref:ATP-binding cassette domain-containing protein n=1 Tax=Amycolatopsis sp. YIM 10 TaxID=2653857 RepID=UPI0012903003|nr:ABC transporter ATP-binding protein [Amycolatopsis sp. YIM 10]
MTGREWPTRLARRLVELGVEPGEAARLADDSHAEARAAALDPAELYGPANAYAATLAQAARETVPMWAPLRRSRGPVVLRLSGVTKRYRRREVLRGVDLTLRGGEVAAVVGANGSGKSTLLDICAGTTKASGGIVERTERVGYAPQQHGVAQHLTAEEHFRLFGAVHGMSGRKAVATGSHLCSGLGWRPRRGVVAAQLSGGTQQKLNVVLGELNRPDLILLDEPYQGFDQGSYVDLWAQIFAWRDAGAGVLVVTHLLHDLDRVDHLLELTGAEDH